MNEERDGTSFLFVVAGLLVLIWPGGCSPAAEPPQFKVVAVNAPRFAVVENRATAPAPPAPVHTGDLPLAPAPPGHEWRRYQGEPWRLHPTTTAAPAVVAPAHFPHPYSPAAFSPGASGAGTPARSADTTGIPTPTLSGVPGRYATPTGTPVLAAPLRALLPSGGTASPWSGSYGTTGPCGPGG